MRARFRRHMANYSSGIAAEYAGAHGGDDIDPILSLRGMGKAVWAHEDADAYVGRLREGWR